MRTTVIALLAVLVVVGGKHSHRPPVIDLHGADEFIGLIREDQQVVSIAPRLAILSETGPVCKYEFVSTSGDELPFEAVIQNEHEGTAIVKVKDGFSLDCSRNEFSIKVVAVKCHDEKTRSEPVPLKITVKDTNNHAPEFDAPWYSFDVEEGHIYKVIAKVYANDKDCGQPYGTICRYEITNALEKSPFRMSDDGVLSNIVPLNYSDAQSHILTIVAHDCGMRRSKSTLITINVIPKCHSKISNVEDSEYVSGDQMLLPKSEISFCKSEESVCVPKQVEAKLVLTVDKSSNSNVCGLDKDTVDLLAKPIEKSAPASPEDEDEDDDDEDSESEENNSVVEEEKYLFDGKSNSVIVPSSLMKSPIPEKFTLSFNMKHSRGSKEDQSTKQNILCESDENHLNRHHFAVYIRHCKLELLLRREAEHATAEFRAAEWRWSTPEVCDNEWHSYSILFNNLDDVQLYIDGKKFSENDRNPEILDDWPLHETKGLKTRLTVGACWHARSQNMVQYFNGYLSSVKLLPGKVEKLEAINCDHEPSEKLVLSEDKLKPGDIVIFNKNQNEITLKANDEAELSKLIQKVKFNSKNSKKLKAKIEITAKESCQDGKEIFIEPIEMKISSKKAENKTLSISGMNMINTDQRSLKVGTSMLPDVEITVTQADEETGKPVDVTGESKLSWCRINMNPSRDMDLEYFSSPAALIASLNVDFEHDKQGIMLKGEESVKGYKDILSKIHYFNTRPESYNKRLYTIQCLLSGSKVLSNDFTVTMTIEGGSETPDVPVERVPMKSIESIVESIENDEELLKFGKQFEQPFESNRLQNILEMDLPRPKALLSHRGYEVGQGAVAGGAIAIVVVICVGFLLVLLVVGVMKMRDTPLPRRRKRKSQSEGMEWDDSGMNITMNPLEDVEKNAGAVFSEEDEEEDSSDNESYHDEEDMTEDDEDSDVLPHSGGGRPGLEWDDSTLTNVSRTYRI
ncbi:hypothetical protein FO519_006582 [Halicephalobus sp. NKZ332]|nr:hypothetical protein FO519_006582 [Halicephalobus sp. NKZ332]